MRLRVSYDEWPVFDLEPPYAVIHDPYCVEVSSEFEQRVRAAFMEFKFIQDMLRVLYNTTHEVRK